MKIHSKNGLLVILYLLVVGAFTTAQTVNNISRKTINSGWQFHKGDNVKLPGSDVSNINWESINLPHTWNVNDVIDDTKGYYLGINWYSNDIFISKSLAGKKLFLFFEGVNQVAELYVNGKFVGKHIGGYTAFRFDITDYVKVEEKNKILVKVDNSYTTEIAPISADFTFYGGIYRDVFLEVKESIHFDMSNFASSGVFIDNKINGNTAISTVHGKVYNGSKSKAKLIVQTTIFDKKGNVVSEQTSKLLTIAPLSCASFSQLCNLNSVELWSPDSPILYRVENKILSIKKDKVFDALTFNTAYRTITVHPDKGVFVNGEKVKLIGANRHQDFNGIGNALTDNFHRQDMELLKEMGANFIRISHYPQDPSVLEACDELGLIVWEEIPIVNEIGKSTAFTENAITNLREMIKQHYNHPSIAFWGYMNEVLLGRWRSYKKEDLPMMLTKTKQLAESLDSLAKMEDPGRKTVIAHHGDFDAYKEAGLNDVADICGWNLYYGWYNGGINDGFDGFDTFVETYHKAYPAHPIIISEYGAGSHEGIYSNTPKRFDFSMQWFERYHEEYLARILRNDAIVGASVWNFVDFNSEGRVDVSPHINNKGLLYSNRKPKDVYFLYKSILSKEPVLKIAVGSWTHRVATPAVGSQIVTEQVKIYSNCEQVEFFLDGKLLGKSIPDSLKRCFFDVPFHGSQNELVALGHKNGKIITEKVNIQYDFIPNDLKESTFREINVNVGAHFNFIDTKTNIVWVPDKAYSEGSYGYIGGKRFTIWEGFRNGTDKAIAKTADEPIFQTQQLGLDAYRFDVANGWYEVELNFAELLNSKEIRSININNLGANNINEQILEKRVFDVFANGVLVLENFNLAEQIGELTASSYKFRVNADQGKGVQVSFIKKMGEPMLNAISLRKL